MSTQPNFAMKEQNFGGVTHIYRDIIAHTYVVEVGLTTPVNGGMLQEAVDKALARMPYFTDALVERDGDFYYAVNPLPFEVAEGGLRAVGGPATNWHCVDVTYEGNAISFSMFHGFCDGLGLNLLIEATLYHYMCLKDGVTYPSDGLRIVGTPQLEGEEFDAFSREYPMKSQLEGIFASGSFYHLPEIDEEPLSMMRGVSFRVSEAEFMDFTRSCKSSPAAMLTAIMGEAVLSVHPEAAESLGALIPLSNRAILNAPNTFKNCFGAVRLIYRPNEMGDLDFAGRAAHTRTLLKKELTSEAPLFTANAIGGAVRKVGAVMHSYAEKKQALNLSKHSNNDTFMVDYVGGLRAQGFEDQIVSTRYRASMFDKGFRTVILYLTATAGHFDIELVRAFQSDVYVGAFTDQLERLGVAFTCGDEESYQTPFNGLIPGLGLA